MHDRCASGLDRCVGRPARAGARNADRARSLSARCAPAGHAWHYCRRVPFPACRREVEAPAKIDALIEPRWIAPVRPAGALLQGHAIAVDRGVIQAVLPAAAASGLYAARNVVRLPDHLVVPGLVNAHCHLDYTSMAGEFPPPTSFTDWIKLITAAKAGWSYSDYAESWLTGAKMLVQTGTTTVADIEAVPELLPEVWEATPLRVYSFLELTGIKSRRDPHAIVQQATDNIEALQFGRCRCGLRPTWPAASTRACAWC